MANDSISDANPAARAFTVGDIVRRTMPFGSILNDSDASWNQCPWWPADLFAVAARLVQASSCYAEPSIALSRNKKERREKTARANLAMKVGKQWSKRTTIPNVVIEHWDTLVRSFKLPLVERSRRAVPWKRAALALMAISDETLAGAGYFPPRQNEVPNFIWTELMLASSHPPAPRYLHLPESLTNCVPTEVACVLPKGLTPEVGCTLRSLSHHVALVPGNGVVRAEWYVGQKASSDASNKIQAVYNLGWQT